MSTLGSIAGGIGMFFVLRRVLANVDSNGHCSRFQLLLTVLQGLVFASIATILLALVLLAVGSIMAAGDGVWSSEPVLSTIGKILIGLVFVAFGGIVYAMAACIFAGPIAYLSTRLILFKFIGPRIPSEAGSQINR